MDARARDLLRQRSARIMVSLEHADFAREPEELRNATRAELRRFLLDALNELSEVQRTAILLHDVEGWKHREIATLLELPAGTVRSHVHHARAQMRRRLQPYKDGDT